MSYPHMRQAQRNARRRHGERHKKLQLERLEDRRLLSVVGDEPTWDAMPWAAGLTLSDSDLSKMRGQTVYLDTDGASDLTYRGPITMENLSIGSLALSNSAWPGREAELSNEATWLLNSWFAPLNVMFTLSEPRELDTWSTVYVGGSDEPFAQYGSFWGLAEGVDRGNVHHSDTALVFAERVAAAAESFESLVLSLALVIGHESAHLLGFAHTEIGDPDSGPLADVAHKEDVHNWLSQQAYERFAGEFGVTSMQDYRTDFAEGAENEDSWRNPFGQITPFMRHFWGHDDQFQRVPTDGLAGYDAAPQRAIRYMSGGFFGQDLELDWLFPPGYGAAENYVNDDLETAFDYLGHVAHLLQDMAVPAHVHNDMHVGGDPYEDWVGGVAFPSSTDPDRWTQYALPAGSNSAIRSPQEVAEAVGLNFVPGYASGAPPTFDIATIYGLFLQTASTGDDYDSLDFFGEIDNGTRTSAPWQGEALGDYDSWTVAELDQLARRLVPEAIVRSAELIRYFYGVVDTETPKLSVTFGGYVDGAQSPQVVRQPTFRITVGATDEDTGDSGISNDRLGIRYRQMAPSGSWSSWMTMPDLTTGTNGTSLLTATHRHDLTSYGFAGQHGAGAEYRFQGQAWYTYEFDISAEDGAGNTVSEQYVVRVEPYQVNVVEVLDTSGSMSDENKMAEVQAAASMFVGLLETQNRIGVVSYSSSAGVAYPLTQITDTSVRDAAIHAINGLSAGGNTSIGSGIRVADGQLDQYPDEPVRAMIVLSDGIENTSPYAVDVIASEVDPDIRIYTVGFGSDADVGLLSQIAASRGGRFLSGGTGNLAAIYDELSAEVADEQGLLDRTGRIRPSETVSEHVVVDASCGTLTVGVTWPGSDLDISLVAPDGTIIDRAIATSDSTVHLIEGPTYEYLKIDSPAIGVWEARVTAVEVALDGEPYRLVGRVTSSIHASAVTEITDVPFGDVANLRLQVDDGAPIVGAQVQAEVFVPWILEVAPQDVPQPLDDYVTVASHLEVSEAIVISAVNVRLDITHSYDGDLDAFLIAPDGTRIELFTDVGGSGNNFTGTILDDDATTLISSGQAPFTGRFRPESSLSQLTGRNAAGTWTLEVVDDSSGDRGQLNSWGLQIAGVSPDAEATPLTLLYDDGLHNDGAAADGIYGNDVLLGAAVGSYAVQYHVAGNASSGAGFTRTVGESLRVTADYPHTVWNSSDVPRPINDYTFTNSTLSINQSLSIADVDVRLDITHTYCTDLDAHLVAPDGTRVELFTDVGGSGNDFSLTMLDDEASSGITQGSAPFSGSFRPEGLLSALDGHSTRGIWTLEVYDDAGGDQGQLNGWALAIAAPTSATPNFTVLRGATPLPSEGTLTFGTAIVATIGPERTLTIRNNGTENLHLSGFTLPVGFHVIEAPYGVVAPGGTAELTFQLETSQLGTYTGLMRFLAAHAGTDAVEYSLHFQGIVAIDGTNQLPEIGWLTADVGNNQLELLAGGVRDNDGKVTHLTFYLETNHQAGLQIGSQGDQVLGSYANPQPNVVQTVQLESLSVGLAIFYAQAIDDRSGISKVAYEMQVVPADGPLLLMLEASSPLVVQPDDIKITTAVLGDARQPLMELRFFRESNGVPGLQRSGDTLLMTDRNASDGWQATVSSTTVPLGSHTIYALGTTSAGELSNTVSAHVTVTEHSLPWHNHGNPMDVNDDAKVSPIDVLLVIDDLNNYGSRELPPPTDSRLPPPFCDTSGDDRVSPIDVLLIIDFLNGGQSAGGEGERTYLPQKRGFDVFDIALSATYSLVTSEYDHDLKASSFDTFLSPAPEELPETAALWEGFSPLLSPRHNRLATNVDEVGPFPLEEALAEIAEDVSRFVDVRFDDTELASLLQELDD